MKKLNKNKLILGLVSVLALSGTGAMSAYQRKKLLLEYNMKVSTERMEDRLTRMSREVGHGTPDNPIVVEYGDAVDLEKLVSDIQKNYTYLTSPTSISLNKDTKLNTKKVGYQQVSYSFKAKDVYKQEVQKEKSVLYFVQDTQKPKIKLNGKEVTVYADQAYDLSQIIKSVKDPVDGNLKEVSKLDKSAKKWEGGYTVETDYQSDVSAGTYTYTVKAMDKNGNESKKSFSINVINRPVVVQQSVSQNKRSNYSTNSYSNSGSNYVASQPQTPTYAADRIYLGGYSARLSGTFNQATVDAYDTAAYTFWNGQYYVADHASQGFKAMGAVSSGYFMGRPIVKIGTSMGYAANGTIYTNDGVDIFGNSIGEIVMYTCSGDGRLITYWSFA